MESIKNEDITRAANAYIRTFKANYPNREFFEDKAMCDHFYAWVRREGFFGWADSIGDKICKIVG